MELQRYISILDRRKWVILLTALVTFCVVAFGTFWATPVYSASAMVRVATGNSGTVTYSDLNYSERLMQTYIELLRSRPFLEQTALRLQSPLLPSTIAGMVKAQVVPDTELIKITAESTDAGQATDIANTLASLLVQQGQALYAGGGKSARDILQDQLTAMEAQLSDDRALLVALSSATPTASQPAGESVQNLAARIQSEEQTYALLLSQYEKARVDEALRANSISVVETALQPSVPSEPRVKLNLILGALVGLLGGGLLALVFENLDPAIHSSDDLMAAADAPLLGRIPSFRIPRKSKQKVILRQDGLGEPPAAEAFRVLGTNLVSQLAASGMKTLLVTSAEPDAGKSTVLANLATALAYTGRNVIIVDCDLRHPSIHGTFGLNRGVGLSEVVLGHGLLNAAIRPTGIQGLSAVTAGSVQVAPAQLLNSAALPELVRQLGSKADVVLWDCPPVLAAADAALLAPLVDGVLLVAARDRSSGKHIALAVSELRQLGAKLVGVVYNYAEQDGSSYYAVYRSRTAAPPHGHGRSATKSGG